MADPRGMNVALDRQARANHRRQPGEVGRRHSPQDVPGERQGHFVNWTGTDILKSDPARRASAQNTASVSAK